MPKLKVKPLEWYMENDHEDLILEYPEVPADFPLIGRDGFYCHGEDVWFEYHGRGYLAYSDLEQARDHFCYHLQVNDEAILPQREADAMREILKTTRDAAVRKALQQRLRLHQDAFELRATYRSALMSSVKWRREYQQGQKPI